MKDESKVHAMIADACLRAKSQEDFEADLRGFVARYALDDEDAAAILAAPPRLALYRRLVRNNLEGVTFKMLARTRARLNDAAPPRAFDATLDAFLDEAAPSTHYLRDVPAELLAWAAPRWAARADLPPWIGDFARHELVEFAVAAMRDEPPPALAEVALDRPIAFTPVMRLMRYAWAVHTLPQGEDDRTAPERRDVTLLVYRDAEHAVRFLELSPLAASILERLVAGETLGAAVPAACADHGAAPTAALLQEIAKLLSDLGARGVVLGARA